MSTIHYLNRAICSETETAAAMHANRTRMDSPTVPCFDGRFVVLLFRRMMQCTMDMERATTNISRVDSQALSSLCTGTWNSPHQRNAYNPITLLSVAFSQFILSCVKHCCQIPNRTVFKSNFCLIGKLSKLIFKNIGTKYTIINKQTHTHRYFFIENILITLDQSPQNM